jgi:hypothetical protein
MRFNPPTSWPDLPAGFTPPEGWTPDPSWPKPPAAWPFWLADDGAPLPVTFAVDVPPWDPRAVGQPGSALGGSWPPAAPVDTSEHARAARRGAFVWFGIGVAAFLAGAASAVFAGRSRSGGWVWTGGMAIGVVLFFRALQQYRSTKDAGAAKPRSVAIVAVGLVVCLGAGIAALVSVVNGPAPVPHEAGSCWTVRDGEKAQAVPCTDKHQYKVVQMVDDQSGCPDTSNYYVTLDSGKVGCLVDD